MTNSLQQSLYGAVGVRSDKHKTTRINTRLLRLYNTTDTAVQSITINYREVNR